MCNSVNVIFNDATVDVKINDSDFKSFTKEDFESYYPNLLHSIVPQEFDNIKNYTHFDACLSEYYCRYVFEYSDKSPVNLRIISEFQYDTLLVVYEYRKNYRTPEVSVKIYCNDFDNFKKFLDQSTEQLLSRKDALLMPPIQ